MTERLSDVAIRIQSVQQLSAVITAMRGIAAARSREARSQLDGVRAYARTLAEAIGQALASFPLANVSDNRPAAGAGSDGGHGIVAFCAEQGFVGVFDEKVIDAAQRLMAQDSGGASQLLIVGDRGLMAAQERGLDVAWSAPMVAHAGEANALAGRIVEEIYRRLDSGQLTRVSIVHAMPGASAAIDVRAKELFPFDFARFPPASHAQRPLFTLPPERLLARLAEEYIFAELCEAVMLSFAAENEARMRAMITARGNVARTLDELVARSRQLRQDEITDEILELAGGARAADSR